MNQYEIEKLNKAVERLTMENEALVDRINRLVGHQEDILGRIWKLESEYALESDVIDTLRINEIDAWMINHETISQKIEKRILAKLKGLE
jgi:uncharacterized coiled-coil protein SlyX